MKLNKRIVYIMMFAVIPSVTMISQIWALPQFALRERYMCSKCHVNPDGGGLRNDYGTDYYSQEILPMDHWGKFGSDEFTTQLNQFIRYGTDVRMQYYYYDDGNSVNQSAFPMQTDIYLNVSPSDRLLFYLESSLLQTSAASEIWAQMDVLPLDGYIRVGQFQPAYGLRLDDHTAFIRGGNIGGLTLSNAATGGITHQGLQWGPGASTIGTEIGLKPQNSIMTVSLGKSRQNPDYSFTFNAAHVFYISDMNLLLGISGFHGNYYPDLSVYSYAGGYGGLNWGKLSILGEIDVTRGYSGPGVTGYTAYSEIDLMLWQGLTVLGRYEGYEPDINHTGRFLRRISVGGDIFPVTYIELQPVLRFLTSAADSNFRQTELLMQVHFWF